MNIKHELNAIAERMQLWVNELGESPLTISEEWHLHEQMKKDAEHLRDIATSMKDPDLYIGDRLKAAIAAGVPRVYEGELRGAEKEFADKLTKDELGVLFMLRARRETYDQALHDLKAVGQLQRVPAWAEFGIGGPESQFLCAMVSWLRGGEVGPRPQKSDYGL